MESQSSTRKFLFLCFCISDDTSFANFRILLGLGISLIQTYSRKISPGEFRIYYIVTIATEKTWITIFFVYFHKINVCGNRSIANHLISNRNRIFTACVSQRTGKPDCSGRTSRSTAVYLDRRPPLYLLQNFWLAKRRKTADQLRQQDNIFFGKTDY